jgi:hypothetical protein
MLSLFRCENSEVDIPAVERVDFFFPMLASGSDDGANAMSVRGQKRRFGHVPVTSGLHPTSDVSLHRDNCRDVPTGDSCIAANSISIRSPRRRASRKGGIRQTSNISSSLRLTRETESGFAITEFGLAPRRVA